MYDDYEGEQFLGPESIVTLPDDADGGESEMELAVQGMVALERNTWARHAWSANDRAYDRLLEDSASAGLRL